MEKMTVVLCLFLFPGIHANAGVLGFFETAGGDQGVLKSERVGCHPVSIALSSGAGEIRKISLKDCEWQLNGNDIKGETFPRNSKIRGKVIKIGVDGGNYYLPVFGATFFTEDSAKVYFADASGGLSEFKLGITGGEIKGFKVSKNKIQIFVYERKTYERVEESRKLSGISKEGRNKLVVVGKNGVESVKEFVSTDSEVYWIENKLVFKIDKALRITKVEVKGLKGDEKK